MKAQDRGIPPLSSTATVSIVITDVNDCAPQFESSRYDLWIAENSPISTTVGTIIARDQDEGDNALIQFRIFGGIDAKLFDIETARNYRSINCYENKLFAIHTNQIIYQEEDEQEKIKE